MINNLDFHKPVMLKEVLKALDVKDGETYLDCTFGAGGYSTAILQKANCKLYAIDRDETAEKFALDLTKKFPQNFVPNYFQQASQHPLNFQYHINFPLYLYIEY